MRVCECVLIIFIIRKLVFQTLMQRLLKFNLSQFTARVRFIYVNTTLLTRHHVQNVNDVRYIDLKIVRNRTLIFTINGNKTFNN